MLCFAPPLFSQADDGEDGEDGAYSPAATSAAEAAADSESLDDSDAEPLGGALLGREALESGVLGVEVSFSPRQPLLGTRWTLSLLVDYPHPTGVSVRPPVLPDELELEEIRTEPYIMVDTSERRTAVTFTFIPHRSGMITLPPFEVITPGGRAATAPITVSIRGNSPQTYRPYFVWDAQAAFRQGKASTLTLRLVDWDPSLPPPANLFVFEVPEQVILEEQALEPLDAERGIVLRLSLIPLAGTGLVLPRRSITHEGLGLEIPPFRAAIMPPDAGKESGEGTVPQASDGEAGAVPPAPGGASPMTPSAVAVRGSVPFPKTKMPAVFGADAARHLEPAQAAWQQGRAPEAVALVRKLERDSVLGPAFAPLRRDMEQSLGINRAPDELWFPANLFVCCILALALLVIVLSLVRKRLNRTATLCLAVLAACLGLGLIIRSQTKTAVLQETDAFHVPDDKGEVSAHFSGGQRAVVRTVSSRWALVETADSQSSWVSVESIIVY